MKSSRTTIHLVGAALFEWDTHKAVRNLAAHGISFDEAATVFEDESALLLADPEHSQDEQKVPAARHQFQKQTLGGVHAEQGPSIRIISAWPATNQERRTYEES